MPLVLVLVAILLSALSGVPGLFLSRSSKTGQRVAAGAMTLGAVAGLVGVVWTFWGEPSSTVSLGWPATGHSILGLDPLSAFFLAPIFVMGSAGAVYGLGYWPQAQHRDSRLGFFWGLLVAGMGLLVISTNAWGFLLGWEVMALSAFFLVATEDKKRESRRAAFVYLVATHIGTLTLFGFFAVWEWATGSFDLVPAANLDLAVLNVLFVLALVGFGLKAGAFPLHFWLPGAHANAPTHVSAMLSGVVLKMGIYGLVRVLFLLPDPPLSWGFVILILGVVSAVFGVVFALAQHDLKRLLAYHSVENIGIILLGLGMALIGRSTHNLPLQALGMAGCLLHVWNHALFKSLLFFGAGSVLQATRTKQIDQLGGLAKTMPVTAGLFLMGSVAIVGLPPLNGFVSEFLLFWGFFEGLGHAGVPGMALSLATPFLALVGALALACFVKVYGTVFLGSPRRTEARTAHESPRSMRLAMGPLALGCLFIGLFPSTLLPLLDSVASNALGVPVGRGLDPGPFQTLTVFSLGLLALIAVLGGLMALVRRPRVVTWDCGYAQPTSRMQYTASSLAQSIGGLFAWILKPGVESRPGSGPFPQGARWGSHVTDLVLDRVLAPAARRLERVALWFRYFQQGLTQNYVTYIVVTLLVLLGFLVPFQDILALLTVRL